VRYLLLAVSLCSFSLCLSGQSLSGQTAQPSVSANRNSTVPRWIRFSGSMHDAGGKPLTGIMTATFTLYAGQNDDSEIWQETQTVTVDPNGNYRVLLGSNTESGLPLDIFSSADARWLGVRAEGQIEQPRVLLLSVAYAFKAADADRLGGRPLSDFVLTENLDSVLSQALNGGTSSPNLLANSQTTANRTLNSSLLTPSSSCATVTSDGTGSVNQLTKFSMACNIENSAIFEAGGNVGIGNTAPAGTLDVSGTTVVRGSLSALGGAVIAPTATATTAEAFGSNPLDFEASVYNTALSRPTDYVFRWQAEPTGNDSTNTGATLNLLYGVAGDINETGLSIAKNGILTFAPGQTFPALGTVTSVSTGSGLTGGPITKSGTISIAAGGVTNSLLANPSLTIKAGSGLSGGGAVELGGSITLTNSAPSLGGTVTNVATGTGLSGGPIATNGTVSLDTGFTDARYLQLSGGSLTGLLKGTTASFTGVVTSGRTVMENQGLANTSTGYNSNPLDFISSSYDSATKAAVTPLFRWQAEPTGNNSESPGSSIHLLFSPNGVSPVETGLSIASNGRLIFSPGQTFPGVGTITQVTAGSGLSGGGSSGSVSLGLLNTCSSGQSLIWNGKSWVCGNYGTVAGSESGIAYFAGPTSVTSTAAPTDGQILIGSTDSAPTLATLTAGPNVSISNGRGSITVSAAGPPLLAYFVTGGGHSGGSSAAGHNVTPLWGFLLPYDIETSSVTYDVITADNSANSYDLGIFNNSGDLVLNIGPTAGKKLAPALAFNTLPWVQGSKTLVAGRYYLAFTTDCSSKCGAIGATTSFVSFAVNVSGPSSSGGALPQKLIPPADTWNTGNQPVIVIH
jgi:hypothetical protein